MSELQQPALLVALGEQPEPRLARWVGQRASRALDEVGGPSIRRSIELALELAPALPAPAQGSTIELWESLATLGAVDLTLARVVEPHLDAVSILSQAGRTPPPTMLYGVYAAEGPGGPSNNLNARPDGESWILDGGKPWCSLVGHAQRALVTAWVDDASRGLFEVDLTEPGVEPRRSAPWVSRGLAGLTSTGVDFSSVPATAVGDPDWYVTRPGFAWGGVGVAAIWFGAAVALARTLLAHSRQRSPDQIALMHLGAVDASLSQARACLIDTASAADSPRDENPDSSALLSQRVRLAAAETVETVLTRCGHGMGPGPLTGDEKHARRVADLTVYVRQHHAERDAAALGRELLAPQAARAWRWW